MKQAAETLDVEKTMNIQCLRREPPKPQTLLLTSVSSMVSILNSDLHSNDR